MLLLTYLLKLKGWHYMLDTQTLMLWFRFCVCRTRVTC